MTEAAKIIIDGTEYSVPDDDDWELVELAEFNRLRDKWGDMGATIAIVWIVKHRENPAFTVEQAERVKASQIEEVSEADVPLAKSDGKSETDLSLPAPSEILDVSGHPQLAETTV